MQLVWEWLALSWASLKARLVSSNSSVRDLTLVADRWALTQQDPLIYTPLLTYLQHYKGKYCVITPIIFCVCHLASFARSSVTSRVSCRFMSSHCATLLSRLLFCSFSFRWACFSSATISNKSLSSLKTEQRRQSVGWWQTWPLMIKRGENKSVKSYLEHWWLSGGVTWLEPPDKSRPERKINSLVAMLKNQMSNQRPPHLPFTGMFEALIHDAWLPSTSVLKHRKSLK